MYKIKIPSLKIQYKIVRLLKFLHYRINNLITARNDQSIYEIKIVELFKVNLI